MIDSRYFNAISKVFTKSYILDLISKKDHSDAIYLLRDSGILDSLVSRPTYYEIYNNLYKLLFRRYRCEYIYKNAIATKLLLGKYSPNTTTLINELRLGKVKADVVLLNGTSQVFEIKTELDNYERLNHQIEFYKKGFDQIFIITSEDQFDKLNKYIDAEIGIYFLTDKYTLRKIRNSKSYRNHVDQHMIFCSLRKSEYCNVIKSEFGYIPDVPNTEIFTACNELFSGLSPSEAHDSMVRILSKRKPSNNLLNMIDEFPYSLHYNLITSNYSNEQLFRLKNILNSAFI